MKGIIPSWTEIGRETLILLAGALLAALIMSRMGPVREFVQKNTAFGGCDCDNH
jgi:hypothetical protein